MEKQTKTPPVVQEEADLNKELLKVLEGQIAEHARKLLESREEGEAALKVMDDFFGFSPCPTIEEILRTKGPQARAALVDLCQTLVGIIGAFDRFPAESPFQYSFSPEDRNDAAASLNGLQIRLNRTTGPLFTEEEWGKIQPRFRNISEKMKAAFILLEQEVANSTPVEKATAEVKDKVGTQL